ncbi:MAG TPA: DUF4349 domain-containing protein [Pyrinomonadaceae bacterium]|nr:DUF4349 domain-containing protein [Pyrinomonadaceae bacterium]
MKKTKFTAVLLLASFFSACSSNATDTSVNTTGAPTQNKEINALAPQAQISLNQAEQTQTAPIAVERKIIRNADLQLEANAPEEAQQKITQIAESKGGFVVESMQSSSDAKATTRDTVTMTVRVPSAKFDEALSEIRQTASRVIIESVKGQDVTEEFIDIEARLKTQKALEAQFLEIMKRSNSVEDALNVQTEIARVRGEIEKIEGRKRFLESQASLSTVKIKLQSPTAFSANSTGFFYQLKEAFGDGFDAALNFILILVKVLIALLPFLILIVLPIYLLIRYILRKNRKQKLASDIAREEIKSE